MAFEWAPGPENQEMPSSKAMVARELFQVQRLAHDLTLNEGSYWLHMLQRVPGRDLCLRLGGKPAAGWGVDLVAHENAYHDRA